MQQRVFLLKRCRLFHLAGYAAPRTPTRGTPLAYRDALLESCDIVLDRTYHTKAFNQAMMETFRTYTTLDRYGRLHVVSSTQIVFHVRRILSRALGIPKSCIRVEKPRIGGSFGAKSIGGIVINTPAPAIAHAIQRATGVWHWELPITPEKIAMSAKDNV